jgi:polysaccharide chain length determinant protein (PEP-CTERM system associated)
MLPGKQYSLSDYAAMALRWRWVIVVPFLVGSYIALIVSSRLPEMFQSDTLIQVVPQRIPSSLVQSTVTMRTVDRLSTLTEQILSRTELEQLIIDLNLYPEQRARQPMQDVVESMRRQWIRVEPVINNRRTDADSFYIRFSYTDPATARRVTERLASLFIDVNTRDRNNLASQTQEFLLSQLAEAKKKLEETEQRMQGFREQNAGRLPTQLGYNMQAMQNAQLRAQSLVESIARDRDRRLILERLLEEAQNEVIDPASTAPARAGQPGEGNTPAATTAQQLAAAKQALTALELRLKPEHPDTIRTKAVVAKLEAQLAVETKAAEEARLAAGTDVPAPVLDPREAARRARVKQLLADVESLNRDIARKESDEERIRTSIDEVQGRIEQVPGIESDWIALTRDYDTQSRNYKELLAKSEDAQLAANLEERQIGEQFRILDPARTPVRPLGVDRLETNAMGAAIGLGIGLLLAALLELRDRTFRKVDDIVEVLQLPVVALVPQVLTALDRRRIVTRRLVGATVGIVVVAAGAYGFWVMRLWNYVV